MIKQKTTLKAINQILTDAGFSNLTAGKPSLLSPFVLVERTKLWNDMGTSVTSSKLWNNRIGEFDTIKELKAFVLGFIKAHKN